MQPVLLSEQDYKRQVLASDVSARDSFGHGTQAKPVPVSFSVILSLSLG